MTFISIGRAPDNRCRILHESVAPYHAVAEPLSGAEYLLRGVDGKLPGVARQSVVRAKIDKFTPLKIGQVHTNLRELLERGCIEPQVSPLERYNLTYPLAEGKTYLAGASPICDIVLASPRVNWHALEISSHAEGWRIKAGRQRLRLQAGEWLRYGPYRLEFTSEDSLKVTAISHEALALRDVYTAIPGEPHRHSLHGISLPFGGGEFTGIIGPSGAGKSTLLKAIRGLIPLHAGRVTLAGRDLTARMRGELGLVPQDDVVIGELTVEENLAYAARLRLPADWPDEARRDKVDALLDAMDLQRQRHQRCTQISGGQRKRVNLALELILEPAFLLADEVCSGLSALDSDNILQHLRQLASQGTGVLLTIHSPDIEAFDLMDRLLVLDTGGYIAYYGPPLEGLTYFSRSRGESSCLSPKLIFDVLEKKKQGTDERAVAPQAHHEFFKSSQHYRDYVEMPLQGEDG